MNRTNKGMVLLAALLLAVLIGYPVFIIIIRSFTLDGALSLENYKEAFFDSSNYKALMHSLIVSASSTVLATIIGCGAAYFTVRTDMAFKKLVHSLFLFNFFIPPFIMAMTLDLAHLFTVDPDMDITGLRSRIMNVHISQYVKGSSHHSLMDPEGELSVSGCLRMLMDHGYDGTVAVEAKDDLGLSAARANLEILKASWREVRGAGG